MNHTLSRTDPLGRVNRFSYDENGNVLSNVNPLGARTAFVYDARNLPISVTNAADEFAVLDKLDKLFTNPKGFFAAKRHKKHKKKADFFRAFYNQNNLTPEPPSPFFSENY